MTKHRAASAPALRAVDRPGRGTATNGNPEYRETSPDAEGLAQELNDTDRLAGRRLANSRGRVTANPSQVDSERVRALEAAVDALAEDDPRRARVLALLACELHDAGDPTHYRALAEEAIETARAAGDPAVLAHTLTNAIAATWGTDKLAGAPTGEPTRSASPSNVWMTRG